MKRILLVLLLGTLQGLNAQDLKELIQLAEQQNPELQAFRLRYNLAEEKVSESRWLPGTEISAGYFASEPETRTGAQKARFSARQMLPWFGTRAAREGYARSMAEADFQVFEVARRQVALEVTRSYYDLYQTRAQRAVLEENLELLATYEKLALTSLEVARASAVDVLRLQIRQNEIRERQAMLDERYTAELTRLNALLNRPSGTGVALAETAGLPEADALVGTGLELNPELLRFDKLFASVAEAEALNQKEAGPALGVGVDYIPVQERTDMDVSDNGKDVFMPMISVSVPLFDTRYASRSRQNALRQQELEALRSERRNVLETTLARAISGRNTARIRYETQRENLRKARDAEQLLLRSYETGTIDFSDVLEIQELQLRFQLEQIDAVKEYYNQIALIQYITD